MLVPSWHHEQMAQAIENDLIVTYSIAQTSVSIRANQAWFHIPWATVCYIVYTYVHIYIYS